MNPPEISLLLTEATALGENAVAAFGGGHRVQQALERAPQLRHAALALFGLPSDTAIAPLRYLGDGGEPGTLTWVCADPVHLAVRGDGLALIPLRLALTPDDRQGFCAALNAVFSADGTHAVCIADRGYIAADKLAVADFTALAAAQSRDLKPTLPTGPAGPHWRRRMTEAQMLLHEAPFNTARAARGAPAVNGVWFWGAGCLPTKAPPTFAQVWSDEPVTLGLARHAGIASAPPPDDADTWLRQLAPGKHLWVVEGRDSATAAKADAALASLLRALARDAIANLNVAIGDRLLQLTPHDVSPWWRRAWWRGFRSRRARPTLP